MQESPYLNDNDVLLNKLQRSSFLGEVGEKYTRKLLQQSKVRKFDDGETITKEGAHDPWVYLIFSGAVKIIKNYKEINRLTEVGSTFGEIAVLDGKPRSASVVAMGPTVCLAIDASFVNDKSDPLEQALFGSTLYKLFAEVLAERIRKKDVELEKALFDLNDVRKQRDKLWAATQELEKVQAEFDKLKKEVAKRWMIK